MIFETHAHYDDERFEEDRDALITSMPGRGVGAIINVGASIESTKTTLALSEKYPFVYAAVGVHPSDISGLNEETFAWLKEQTKKEKVAAVGEIGLDYYYDLSPREIQKTVFERQLDLAYELKKPVILHIRDAHGDTIEILRAHRDRLPHCVVHCCSASWESAKIYLSLDCMISFAGPVTFKKSVNLQEVAKNVPLDRLMIETDSPYLAPEPVRGHRNEPLNVGHICRLIAALRQMDAQQLCDITRENGRRFYGIG